jgi:hypothetical protein
MFLQEDLTHLQVGDRRVRNGKDVSEVRTKIGEIILLGKDA